MAKSEEKAPAEFDFGEYAVEGPYEYHFARYPEKYWNILPVSSGHEVARAKFLMYNRIAETADGTRFEQPPVAREIAHREIALLFGGTNMTTKGGESVLPASPPLSAIEFLLDKMPPDMVNEIWVEIGRLYPKWGPSDPKVWTAEAANLET